MEMNDNKFPVIYIVHRSANRGIDIWCILWTIRDKLLFTPSLS